MNTQWFKLDNTDTACAAADRNTDTATMMSDPMIVVSGQIDKTDNICFELLHEPVSDKGLFLRCYFIKKSKCGLPGTNKRACVIANYDF